MRKLVFLLFLVIFVIYTVVYYTAGDIKIPSVTADAGNRSNSLYIQRERQLFDFIERKLLKPDGSIFTNTSGTPEGNCTLSESVGLLMQYSVQRGRKELFDRELGFLKREMLADGRFIKWRAGELDSSCNAAADDFRIIRALLDAYDRWGDKSYFDTAGFIQQGMYDKLVIDGNLHELYDWGAERTSGRIPLCYIDLYTMDRLRIFNRGWSTAAANGESLIRDGHMDSPAAVFYKYYSYENGQYVEDEDLKSQGGICLVYDLITITNLTDYNYRPEPFCAWLDYEITRGELKARYDPVSLQPAGEMESTAVYALAAMYSERIGEKELAGKLLDRMLGFMVTDTKSEYFAGFGDTKAGSFHSFDNLTALLALAQTDD